MVTSTMTNKAAFLIAKQSKPLQVKEAPTPDLPPDYVMIKVHAVAINPVDSAMQELGIIIEKYPAVIGCDLAGTIVEIGPEAQRARADYEDVTPLKVGDRVIAGTDSMTEPGAFQLYASARATQVTRLPDQISFADGCVIPLCLATAASCMFDKGQMDLPPPQLNIQSTGQVLLIWGAGSSVGTMAVQMAKAAGLEVVATASSSNQDYLRSIGVDHPFDYRDPGVVDKIVTVMKKKRSLGAYNAIQDADSLIACGRITQEAGGEKVVGTVLPAFLPFPEGIPEGVRYTNSYGLTKKGDPWAVLTWGKWVTPALERGLLKCLPEKIIVGKGLEHVQTALDRYKEGISARKVVVELV